MTYYQGRIYTGDEADKNFILPVDSFLTNNIVNVSLQIWYLIVVYIACNSILVIIYGLTLNYKPKRGIFKAISVIDNIMPLIMIGLLITMIYTRYMFTTSVCFCTFENSFFILREIWSRFLDRRF